MSLDGVLNIDKPAGMTSHDVVARIRRVLRTKRVGHAGTLDPDATGVLVVAVGAATRLLPYLPTEPKRYVARIRFGEATDTDDATGKVIAEADASGLTAADLEAVVPRFVGEIEQVPPMVSALHHQGQRLYALARQGIVVEREARRVVIHDLVVSDYEAGARPEATLHVSCGGGTYVRTLCADIGGAFGLPAHMARLRRTAVGRFRIEEAIPLHLLGAADGDSTALSALLPLQRVLDLPTVIVSDDDARRIERGQPIASTIVAPGTAEDGNTSKEGAVIALLHRERLVALGHLKGQELLPFRVFGGMAEPDS
jgi:tRNA pseudouridine55 synthase